MSSRSERIRSPAARWAQLLLGLMGFATSIALMIRGGLGLGPWDAFHVGLHRLTGLTVGTASIVTGIVIIGISMTLKARPGPGTFANMLLVGVFTDLALRILPAASGFALGLLYHIAGIVLIGFSSGMYLGARLGAGPRDGLMTALAARQGWSIRRTRTTIELSVLALGWMMGGKLGVGTVLFAVAVGPSVQWGMRIFGLLPVRDGGSGPEMANRPESQSAAIVENPASIA